MKLLCFLLAACPLIVHSWGNDDDKKWNHFSFEKEHIVAIEQSIDVWNRTTKRIGGTKPEVSYGQQARSGQFPWIASLQRKSQGEYIHLCAGAVIHQHLILTAAHCLYSSSGKLEPPEQVYLGATTLASRNNAEEIFAVADVYWPANYDFRQRGAKAKNDIAIVRISGASAIKPVSLSEYDPRPGLSVATVGWGPDGSSAAARKSRTQLMWATLTLAASGKDPCPKLPFGAMCAVGKSFNYGVFPSSCHGDSGAPYLISGTSVLIGVASFNPTKAVDCAQSPYQGLTSVSTHLETFIKPLMDKFTGVSVGLVPASPPPPSRSVSPPSGMANVSDFEDTTDGCTAYRAEILRNQRFRRGSPIRDPFSVSSRGACATSCIRNQPCMSFNYQHTNRTCTMLMDEGGTLPTIKDVRFSAGFLLCTSGK